MINATTSAISKPLVQALSRHRWLILAGVWFLYYCFGLVVTSIAPLVDVIVNDLDMTLAAMGKVLGAWQFVYLFSAIPLGLALDRFGPRSTLVLAAIIIATSAALRGVANNDWTLWLAVALFGLGGPIISIGAPKVIAEWFSAQERGMAMGIYMTGPALGGITSLALTNSVLMPLVAGRWRYVFFIFATIALLSAIAWLLITSTRTSKKHPLTPDTSAQQTGQILFQLLKVPSVVTVLAMSIGIFALNHGLGNWLPEILRSGGMTPINAGYWATVPTLAGVVGSLTIPRLATPERRYAIMTALIIAAFLAVCLLLFAQGPLLAVGLILQGVARGSMMTLALLLLKFRSSNTPIQQV